MHKTTSNYTHDVLLAVMMCYKGINTAYIMSTLNKSRPTITGYINNWNENPSSIMDNRGGNVQSKITMEMIENILTIIMQKTPSDFEYPQATWNSEILVRYISDTYGLKYSSSWIRKILGGLGFSYKRGVYKQTKADPELQNGFKKNVLPLGYS
jgi:transposase